MDKNSWIGLGLIFVLLMAWQYFVRPSPEEMEAQQRVQDSLARVEDSLARLEPIADTALEEDTLQAVPPQLDSAAIQDTYGNLATSAIGSEKTYELENDLMRVTFSNKGGRITEVFLKDYFQTTYTEDREEQRIPLRLMEDPQNRFEFFLPGPNGTELSTQDLYFEVEPSENGLIFRLPTGNGKYFEQRYQLEEGSYLLDYQLGLEGLRGLPGASDQLSLHWENYLTAIEKNTRYELQYSCQYFRTVSEDISYCSCTKDSEEDADGERLQWVSQTNQFFNTTLIAKEGFSKGEMQHRLLSEEDTNLKKMIADIQIPLNASSYDMQIYSGPNEFQRLREVGYQLEEVIPYGWSIFGTINRWVIRPIFNFLSGFIGNMGIVILMLTLLVKLALYPLTYRMLYSQSKMAALKPQLENLRKKTKDDQQAYQVESMKMYREFGVSPLGGCLPMVLQMPIWFALYRFFPAAIEFRQEGFLWASDLSSYDVIAWLPFEIPFGFGSHISLFTLLWAVTTLIYTFYNTRHMDMSANPAMKYMQYIMPIFFMGFFNSFASGLTCYLLFSNLINITQTVVTKNVVIDQDKVRAELEENRKKPKKKGGFQQRLEAALKEQQRLQAEQQTRKTKTAGKRKK
jgi:YidC/Oxa1 family membrane protein insertase